MNKFAKIAFAAIAASILLFACKTNNDDETSSLFPAMDSRVASYKMIHNCVECGYAGSGFITEQDTLKSWFPHILNNEQAESKCNYFAAYFATSSTLYRYWILSQDIILYQINPSNLEGCAGNGDVVFHAMLVCDDKAETLKSAINFDSMQSYADPEWECDSKSGLTIRGPNPEDVFF